MYDLLIVGAGITAATLAAQLKQHLRICVIDCRSHIAGNCFDERSNDTLIHRYGPHIFHCPSSRIVSFLSAFTEWVPYAHRVIAEIEDGDKIRHVPFPYSQQTVRALGRHLTESEIIEHFFRAYSRKMWGMEWGDLPPTIRKRIPMEPAENSVYHREAFVALPRLGYRHMIENMLDGAEIILRAPPAEWTRIRAAAIVYTGRPDLVPIPGETVSIAQRERLQLDFRTLDIQFSPEAWSHDCVSLHACNARRPWTRKTRFSQMTGGNSDIVSTEVPRQAEADEPVPFYPIPVAANLEKVERLSQSIKNAYPHMHLAGRLGSYRYFDMYQAVGQALTLAERLWKK